MKKLLLNYGVQIGNAFIGMGTLLSVMELIGSVDEDTKLGFNSWFALIFTCLGVIITCLIVIKLDSTSPDINKYLYNIPIIFSILLICWSVYQGFVMDVVVTGLAITGVAIGIIRPIQVKRYHEKYKPIPGELIGWGIIDGKEYQILLLKTQKQYLILKYDILDLKDSSVYVKGSQYRFENIVEARRKGYGIWQDIISNSNSKTIFSESNFDI
jgi:hypothetical protein